MKIKLSILTLGIALFFCSHNAYGQKAVEDPRALRFLEHFYNDYIAAYLDGAGPTNQKKIEAVQSKYCSKRLVDHIKELYKDNELDADPFLDSQDYNDAWTKSLKITKAKTGANIYNASYIPTPENKKVTIHLLVVKQGNDYKIDSVWR